MLHVRFNMFNGSHGRLIDLLHITLRITRSIALKFALIDGFDKLSSRFRQDTTLCQTIRDILTRQLLYRHIQAVAYITPQSTQSLVIEFARLIILHQACCLAQSFGGHLVGTLCTVIHDIGSFDGTLVEDNEE